MAEEKRGPKDVDRRIAQWLASESETWQRDGLVSAEQAEAIRAGYRSDAQARTQKAQARLISALAVFGAVLVSVGVSLFFAANWGDMPRWFRLALIMVVIPAIYGASYWLGYVKGYRRVGVAVTLLGAVSYGIAIHLVAQAYDSPVDDPMIFTYFFLGIVPLAYLTRSQVLTAAALGVFLVMAGIWLADQIGETGTDESQAIFSLATYAMIGLGLYGLGRAQRSFGWTRPHASVFQGVGAVTVLITVYMLSFRYLYEPAASRGDADSVATAGLWVLLCGMGAAGLLGLAVATARSRDRNGLAWELVAAALLAPAIIAAAIVQQGGGLTFPILFNALLFLAVIALVFEGYRRGEPALINIGAGLFMLNVATRLLEISWGLLDRSFAFLATGVVLLAVALLLERGRRRVIDRMAAREGRNAG